MFGSYLMFHWVRGVPFEFNAGAYDNLNMWEQIDNGDQYTPAKKFLLSVPIVLFLLSTHYTHYDLTYFMINFLAVLGVVIPKLPSVSLATRFPLDSQYHRLMSPLEPSNACRTLLWCFGGPIAMSHSLVSAFISGCVGGNTGLREGLSGVLISTHTMAFRVRPNIRSWLQPVLRTIALASSCVIRE